MHASRRARLVNSDEFTGHLTHLSTSEQLYEKDMGASGSHNSKTTQVVFSFEKLPEELIIHILTFVPAKDIILNLRRVCKSWKIIIDSKSLWIAKCHRDNVALPPVVLYDEMFPMDFKKLCVRKPFNRNLLYNWNGAGKTVCTSHFFVLNMSTDLSLILFITPPPLKQTPPGKHPPNTPRDGHCSRRYASYWNEFLLVTRRVA